MNRRIPLLFALALFAARPAAGAGLSVHGLLDVTISERGDGFRANTTTMGDNPFDPYGLRLIFEGTVNPQVTVFGQVILHDPSAPYVDGAYVMWTPSAGRDMHLMAGKLPWLIGTFAPRTYSNKNPLIGKPLMYQHHTTLVWYSMPSNTDELLASAGTGQSGGGYTGGGLGMPVVDDGYWDTGVMATGSLSPFEGSLGFTVGTPGWGNTGEDENHGKTVLGRIGVAPTPWLRIGGSGAYGPYLVQGIGAPMPPGGSPEDYHQKLAMADLELQHGHGELRAEGFVNVWETPTVGDLRVRGGYVEGKFNVWAGLYAAARWDAMRFGEIRDSSGVSQPWDHDRDRIETGLGWRFDRDVLLKGVFQRNQDHARPGVPSRHADLYGMQLTVGF